jgi:hypothetical protein
VRNTAAFCSIAILSLCLLSAALGARADVRLEPAQRDNLGIATQQAASAEVARSWPATAQVMDSAPLIGLNGDLHAAQAAAAGSAHELERSEQLHSADTNVSLKAVEAARAQALADAGRVATLRAQLAASWGRALADMDDTARNHLTSDLAGGKAVLVRAETRQIDAGQAQLTTARLSSLTGDRSWDAQVLGLAAPGAAQPLGSVYLLRAPASPALQVGRALGAELRDRSELLRGVKIPRSAIVRWQGIDWVFVEEKNNEFVRQRLQPVAWLDDGCLVQGAVRAGERIVTVGAEALLAAETASAPKAD